MVNDGQTWPEELERRLRQRFPNRKIEVINAGVSGYCTFQSLINLQTRLLDYDPDVIIVYHVWNDVKYWAEVRPGHDFSQTSLARDMPPPTLWDRLLHSSQCYIFLGAVRRKLTSQFSGGEPMPAASGPDPDLSYGQRVYRRNLVNMVVTARANGVKVVLANEVTLIGHSSSAEEDRQVMWFLPKATLLRAMDSADTILRDVASAERARFVDLRGKIPANLETLMDHIHPTPRGCRLIGEALATELSDLI